MDVRESKGAGVLGNLGSADGKGAVCIEASFDIAVDGDRKGMETESHGMRLEFLFAYGAGWLIRVEDLADYLAGRDRREASAR